MELIELKRKLRDLKKLEEKIRFNNQPAPKKLIWSVFFTTRENDTSVKFPLAHLLSASKLQLKELMDEYFFRVYFQYYQENGLLTKDIYDPNLLSLLGLPIGSSSEDIKRRFRELVKKYHPDCGGDNEKAKQIIEAYQKLTKE